MGVCVYDTVNPFYLHRIHRNHHSPEDSDGVSRHRLVPISPYIAYFLHITLPNGNWIPAPIKLKHAS